MSSKPEMIEWRDSYSVGVPVLDEDHKQLISIINRVSKAASKKTPADWAIGELQDYARDHFAREEKLLEAAGFDGFDAHKREHKSFIDWLNTVKSTYRIDREAEFYLAETVSAYLRDWLNHHILETDMKYKGTIN